MLFEATGRADMRDLAVFKTRLLALVPRYFPAQHAVQATALITGGAKRTTLGSGLNTVRLIGIAI